MAALLMVLSILGWAPPEPLEVGLQATIPAERLEVGGQYEIQIQADLPQGYSFSSGGIPAPIAQIKVPESAELVGQVLTDKKELSKNEFFKAPFELLVDENPQSIPFKLLKEPGAEEAFAINVLVFLRSDEKEDDRFIRRRLSLPLAGGARAKAAAAALSDWGQEETLQIGEKAAAFALPRADGEVVDLQEYLGKKSIVITTYRAHW
jgi:hypothetical protein